MDDIAALRMLERILAVLIGGGSIYLGYRLFFHIPDDSNHQGRLELPGMKLVLTKVGPGIFFAVFGCIVLVYSLLKPVEIKSQRTEKQGETEGIAKSSVVETTSFTGMGKLPGESSQPDTVASPQQRNAVLQAVEMINCLHRLGESHDDLYELAVPAVRQAKRALLISVWDRDNWGDPGVLDMDMERLPDDSPMQFFYHAKYGGCPR